MKLVALWLAVLAITAGVAGSCSVNHRSGDYACVTSAECSSGRTCISGFCVETSSDAATPDATPIVDADIPPPPPDALVCPAECTSCDLAQKACTIDCAVNPDECTRQVACPPGWSCNVQCSELNSCRRGVDCGDSTSCTVSCTGRQSCQDVTCGAGDCEIVCSGRTSCAGVTCTTGSCKLDCSGIDACSSVVGGSGTTNVDCNGPAACASVSCGTGRCGISCTGGNSCNTVACNNACACDVACQFNAACAGVSCTSPACEQNSGGCSADPGVCNTCP